MNLRLVNCFAELERGIYFLQYHESYINQSNVEKFVVFDRGIKEWTNSEIVSFIKRMSKKLRNIKIKCTFQDEEAFDSIFLPNEVIINIREDIDNFLISRNLYVKDLQLAWRRGYMLVGPPGNGKCLGKDTPVLMFDGTIKYVQDVKTGDILMGDDSTPRKVLSTCYGKEQLYKIIPVKGTPYTVNESHILSLKESGGKGFTKGKVRDISVIDYLQLAKWRKHHLKGYKVAVDFKAQTKSLFDPYALGYWLGNGSEGTCEISTIFPEVIKYFTDLANNLGLQFKQKKSDLISYRITTGKMGAEKNNWGNKSRKNIFLRGLQDLGVIKNKHIPFLYKTSDRDTRLKLLAGLLDSDGHLDKNNQFEITLKIKELSDDVVFLAQSLGFYTSIKECRKSWNSFSKGKWYKGVGDYFRIIINGDINFIPTIVNKKKAKARKQIKNALVTGITIEKLNIGEYFGFELDGNGRFLLGDFTVTHNTLLIRKICDFYGLEYFDIRKAIESDGTLNLSKAFDGSVDYYLYPEQEKPRVCILEDLDKFVAFQSGEVDKDYGSISLHSMLKGLDGIDQIDGIMLFATTNFPDVLHEALTGRPGRFDKIYKINKPTEKDICKLLKYYKINIVDGSLDDIAKDLKESDSSMAFVAEFVKSSKMKYMRNDIKLEEARVILHAIHEHQNLCSDHFQEPKSIGFKK